MLTFVPAVDYSVGQAPQAIVAADFNNDGQLDLATANIGDNSVSLLFGDGQGGFSAENRLPMGATPLSVAVGDFDSDGNLDLATATPYDVRVMPGDGDGSFGAPAIMGVYGSPDSVAVGDFNGDGKLDLGVTSNAYYYYPDRYYGRSQGYANVLLGNADGTFSAANSTYLGYDYHITALAADLNGDLKDDFVTFNYYYGTGSVLLGDSSGYLQGPTSSLYTGDYSYAVAAGDLDADGNNDLVISNYYGNSVGVFLGDGSGGFSSAGTYSIGTNSTSIVLGDFNQDGHLDVVTTNYYPYEVHILYGEGDGAFSTPTFAAVDWNPWAIAAGDFNGDTWPDIATANYSANTVSVLINDGIWPDPSARWLRIDDVTVTEGHVGTVAAEFMVTLSASSDQPVTVQYDTVDGTATAGSDYQSASGTLIIPAGQTTGTITVLVNGDRLGEPNETFFVYLSSSSNATITDGQAVGTIMDDEPLITISDATVTEGHEGTVAADFTVTLSAPSDQPVTVWYGTADGTATAGSDYQPASGTLIIPAGQTMGTITVLVNGDRLGEAKETFFVIISSTNATITDGLAAATILDDEPLITITDATVTEGDGGTVAAVFTVTRSGGDLAGTSIVNYSTANGGALAGSDYVAASGTVTFAPGETTQTITILVSGDLSDEYDQGFYVILSAASGAVITDGQAVGIIVDNDPPPTITITPLVSAMEGNGTKLFNFIVTLSAASEKEVRVNFATADGSATTADNDYVARSGTLVFVPGTTSMTISVQVKGDKKRESNETFFVKLSGATHATIAAGEGRGEILDDDAPPGKKNV